MAHPVYNIVDAEPEKYLSSTPLLINLEEENHYNLSYQPTMTPFITEPMLRDHLHLESLSPKMVELIKDYLLKIRESRVTVHVSFTMEGLEYFFETGRFSEILDFLYTPLAPKHRIELMHNLLDDVERGRYKPRVIKTAIFPIPLPVCLTSCSLQSVIIFYTNQRFGLGVFQLSEVSMLNAFNDFLVYVQDSELVYSEEESLKLMRDLLDKYERKFGIRGKSEKSQS